MALILVIDSESAPDATVERLRRDLGDRDDQEVVFASSCDDALAVIDRAVPDLVLFPVFLSLTHESAILSRLLGTSSSDPLSLLLIPLVASDTLERSSAQPRWFYWFKPRDHALVEGRDIHVLAQQVRNSLADATPDPRVIYEPSKLVEPPERLLDLKDSDPRERVKGSESEPPSKVPIVDLADPLFDMVERPATTPPTALLPDSENASVLREWADEILGIPTSGVQRPRPATQQAATPPPLPRAYEPAVLRIAPSEPEAEARDIIPASAAIHDSNPPARLKLSLPAAAGSQTMFSTDTALPATDNPQPAADEPTPSMRALQPPRWMLRRGWLIGIAATILIAAGAVFASNIAAAAKRLTTEPTGIAELHSVPSGSEVWADGKKIGVTPLNAALAVGRHAIEFRYRNAVRAVELAILADKRTVHREDLQVSAVGELRLISAPPGVTVLLDGEERGVTPLTINDVPAGRHAVLFKGPSGTVQKSVLVEQDRVATAQASIYSGWVALFSPFELKISEGGKELQLDEQQQVMLSPGAHKLRLANESLGYAQTQAVDITPGEVTRISIDLPQTTATITSTPSAEVWLDGVHVGQTPLSNFKVNVGAREFVFRHPIMGERRVFRIATTANLRIDVDLTQPTE